VSVVPLNHPIRLAEEYAMLDVLSDGRLEYGIGRGFLNVDSRPAVFLRRQTLAARRLYFFPQAVTEAPSSSLRLGRDHPGKLHWAGQMGTAFFIPAPEMVKANIGLYRNALMKLAARVPSPEGPNPLDHCEKKRRG
jgi:alkanesulfonate monooxygenase SsuD/methylene tetrahydromethanopterin reductase-like flavin-dependent oxidoreductase (luciferase family)